MGFLTQLAYRLFIRFSENTRMKKVILKLPLISVFSIFCAHSAPVSSSAGGTGYSNNDSYTLRFDASTQLGVQQNSGIIYFDGTKYTSSASFLYSGTNNFQLLGSFPAVYANLINTQALSTQGATFYIGRKDNSGSASNTYEEDLSQVWEVGLKPGDSKLHVYDWNSHSDRMTIDQSGNVNIPGLTASQLVATDSSKNLISGNLTGDVTTSGLSATIANNAVTNAKIANSTIDVTTKITGTVPFANGGFGFSTATTGDIFYASGTNTPGKLSDVATNQILISGGIGVAPSYSANPRATTLGLGAAVTLPSITSQLNISSTTQNSARIVLSGQEYFASGNSSADGIAFLLGVNRSNNRQLWIGDSALLASNSSNPLFRLVLGGNTSFSALATDGSTGLALGINTQGGDVKFGENGSGSNVVIAMNGKKLKVKAGNTSSNACFIQGAVLVAGTVTVNTSCAEAGDFVSVQRTLIGGLVGNYTAVASTGSVAVTSSNAGDTSTVNLLIEGQS